MPGQRIPDLTAIAGASTANDDNLVIFDTDANTTKRILRSQLAEGMTPDLPLQYYLGVLNSAPATRLNGDALQLGDYYLDSVTKYTTVYNGSGWNSYASVIAAQTAAEAAASSATASASSATTQASLATAAKVDAEAAEVAAQTAQTAAETARDAAFVNADVYASTAAGLAGTSLNDQFQVVSGPQIKRYSHDSGPVATLVARYPNADFWGTFPSGKLVSAYTFDEVGGNTVYDKYGSSNINLTTPTNPNATRTNKGVRLASGLIQTPSLASVKQVVILYRVGFGETTGFLISGGSGSGAGILGESVTTTETNRISGGGIGWHPVAFRASNGLAARELNRGGWVLLSRDMTTTYTSIFGLGGRHSTTTSRCTDFEISFAFFFNATLTSDEEIAVESWVRREGVKRGIYLRSEDCPVQEDVYIVCGESNADGRSDIADLSAGDQALRLDRFAKILPANNTTGQWTKADGFELGFNQQITAPTIDFGPEYGVAYQRRITASTTRRNARILKLGRGSTYLAPSSTGVASASSWNKNELNSSGLFWYFVSHLQRGLQEMMTQGIGIGSFRVGFWIGLNDATSTTYTVDAATYQGYLQDFLDTFSAQFPGVGLTLLVFRPHTSDPSSNATALGHVRTGMADFDTANANVTVIDTDAYGLEPDNVHYDAAASKAMGITLHG